MQSMRVFSLNDNTATSYRAGDLDHMVKTAEDLLKIIGYHCKVAVYSFQLVKELDIMYMNTLKVGYTSKTHCFTSQIVRQM